MPMQHAEAQPGEFDSPDALIAALYDVISGPAGQARDWDRFRSLFIEDARLMAVLYPGQDSVSLVTMRPEDYVNNVGPRLEEDGFFEKELARRTEQFGHVLHAFSTYAGSRTEDGEPFLRGVNSIQLVHDGTRWWVASVLWDPERPGQPLPARYLPETHDR